MKRFQKNINVPALFANALLALLFGMAIQMTLGVPMLASACIIFLLGLIPHGVSGAALEGLQQEIWKTQLREKLHRDTDFWTDGEDWSADVENDKINFASAGGEPGGEINRTTYPIPLEELTDVPGQVELDEFSTNRTLVKDAYAVELSYNKMEGDLVKHRRKIRSDFGLKGYYGITPAANTADTPIIGATGAERAGSGFTSLHENDLALMAEMATSLDWPDDGRIIRVPDVMWYDLVTLSPTLKAQYERLSTGKIGVSQLEIHGWIVKRVPNRVLSYLFDNGGNMELSAFGVTPVPGTHFAPAVAYIEKDSFVYADGSTKMYEHVDDPAYQGTIINFRHRGICRKKAEDRLMSIYAPTA